MQGQFEKKVFEDNCALGEAVAREIRALIQKKPDALISIAAGTSSIPAFDAILEMIDAGELDLSRARFMAMDEWLDVPMDFEGSMCDFLFRHFLARAGFGETFLFDGMKDPAGECARAEAFLGGKKLDYILFGIGMNGHIALNEPGCSVDSGLRAVDVAPTTASVGQKYFGPGGAKLSRGITIGVRHALEAGKVALTANSSEKRDIVKKAFESEPTNQLPASLLKLRGDVALLLTKACAF